MQSSIYRFSPFVRRRTPSPLRDAALVEQHSEPGDLTAGRASTVLANRLGTKVSTSLGPLAHFRAGLAMRLTPRLVFEGDAVEQMPLSDQKIYATRTVNAKTMTLATGHTVAERNGFNAVFDAIIDGHTIFSAYYSRSLHPGADTVSVGFTYLLRNYLPGKDTTRHDLFRYTTSAYFALAGGTMPFIRRYSTSCP